MTLGGWGRCLMVTLQTCMPKTSAHVNGGTSGGSSMRRPRSEDPHQREQIFYYFIILCNSFIIIEIYVFYYQIFILQNIEWIDKSANLDMNKDHYFLATKYNGYCFCPQGYSTQNKEPLSIISMSE